MGLLAHLIQGGGIYRNSRLWDITDNFAYSQVWENFYRFSYRRDDDLSMFRVSEILIKQAMAAKAQIQVWLPVNNVFLSEGVEISRWSRDFIVLFRTLVEEIEVPDFLVKRQQITCLLCSSAAHSWVACSE